MEHPNPMTVRIIEALIPAGSLKQRTMFEMWGGEMICEVITSSCCYGYPSCVIVVDTTGAGLRSDAWSTFDHEGLNKKEDAYRAMYTWIAEKLTQHASGTKRAVGNFSIINLISRD